MPPSCYLEKPDDLKKMLADPTGFLRKIGLGALLKEVGRSGKRPAWESFRGSSQMQQAARVLHYTPYSFEIVK